MSLTQQDASLLYTHQKKINSQNSSIQGLKDPSLVFNTQVQESISLQVKVHFASQR